MAEINSVDDYINKFSGEVRNRLELIKKEVKTIAPDAEETLGYGIATFKLKEKNFVHFGGYEKHIGFYPTPAVLEHFQDKLKSYKGAKGSVQFPNDQDLPIGLIKEMTEYRLSQFN